MQANIFMIPDLMTPKTQLSFDKFYEGTDKMES